MKTLLLLILLPFIGWSQQKLNLESFEPEIGYENVFSQSIYENEHSSYYLILIKNWVKSHKHQNHTESISVLEGSGTMTIDGQDFEIQKGDFFVIPKNSFHSLRVHSEIPVRVISVQMPRFDPADRVFETSK